MVDEWFVLTAWLTISRYSLFIFVFNFRPYCSIFVQTDLQYKAKFISIRSSGVSDFTPVFVC